jgi:sugar/nucleoside kinase (ribokinase family)
VPLLLSSLHNGDATRRSAEAAATRAAIANADAGNASKYMVATVAGAGAGPAVTARVLRAGAAALPREAVADTTGAGDSFIGSVLYGLATGMSYAAMLRLAGVVAACKCTEVGARAALPQRSNLAGHLLQA